MPRFLLGVVGGCLMMFGASMAAAAAEQGTADLLRVQDRDYGAARGSFVLSCKNTQQKGWTIRSMCKDLQGRWSWTSINFRFCPGFYVENLNGNLVCER